MADIKNSIKTTVDIDSTGAEKGIENINKATEDSAKISNNAAKSQGKFSKAIQGTDEASGGLITKFKLLSKTPLVAIVGALIGAFKFLQEAVGRSGKATEIFSKIGAKFSGVLNGMLAILEPLVVFLGEKLLDAINDPAQAFEDLGETIKNNVINRFKALSVLGGAIAKLFKGDFKGAAKEATDGMIQLSTGITNATDKAKDFAETAKVAFNEAAEATDRLANVEKRLVQNRIALEKQQLTSLRLAEEERQIRDDVSKSIEERIDANKRLGTVLDEQMQRELAVASQNLNFARLQQQSTGDTIENLEAVGDAEIKLLEIRERIAGQKSEQLVNENSLLKEQSDLKQSLDDAEIQRLIQRNENLLELDELEIERLQLKGQNTLDLELDLLERKRVQDTEALNLSNEEIQIINERAALDKEALLNREASALEAVEKTKQIIRDKAIDNISAGIGILSALAGENEALQATALIAEHGVSIAKTIISTQAANQVATAEGAALAIPTAGASVAAASGIVLGNNISAGISIAGQGVALAKGLSSLKKNMSTGSTSSGAGSGLSSRSSGGSNVTPEVINDLSANGSANLGTDTSIGDGATASASNNISASTQGQIVFSEDSFTKFQEQIAFKEGKSKII